MLASLPHLIIGAFVCIVLVKASQARVMLARLLEGKMFRPSGASI